MSLWVSRGGVMAAPPQLTREVAVSDGGQQCENPQLMHVWVGGEVVDEAPQQISACDIPAASRESLAAHRQVSAVSFFLSAILEGRSPRVCRWARDGFWLDTVPFVGFAFCPVRVAVG